MGFDLKVKRSSSIPCVGEDRFFYYLDKIIDKNFVLDSTCKNKKINKMFLEVKKKEGQKKLQLNDLELFFSLIDKISKSNSYTTRKEILTQSNNINHVLFRYFIELAVSLKTENSSWSKNLAKKIVRVQLSDLVFIEKVPLSSEHEKKLIKTMINILKDFKKKVKNDLLVNLLTNHLYYLAKKNSFREIVVEMGSDMSLQYVRDSIRSNYNYHKYFDLWYLQLLNRTSDANLRSLMRLMINKNSLKDLAGAQLWVFQFFYPGDEVLREIILKKINDLWKTGSLEVRYNILLALKNSVLKRDLAKINKDFVRPLFALERNYFKELFNQNKTSYWGLYNLIKLGDRNESYLVKLLP